MEKNRQNSSKTPQLEPTQRFTEDIQSLYTPPDPVPLEIDRKIIDHTRRHFASRPAHRRPGYRVLRRTAAAAAVAALVFITLSISPQSQYSPSSSSLAPRSETIVLREDINLNGRVDILDAFYLARRIEANAELTSRWDINGDGDINRIDVDEVAQAAVRLRKDVL